MALPLPFYDDFWPADRREAAQALWHWHLGLYTLPRPEDPLDKSFEAARERAARGEPIAWMDAAIQREAFAACARHHLPKAALAEQIAAAARLHGTVRFETIAALKAFVIDFVGPHARLLMHLAGYGKPRLWPLVYELAFGFFLTSRLAALPDDLAGDRCFIPVAECAAAGISLEDLRSGPATGPLRKLLWKQVIRARDAFAQGQPLVHECTRRDATALRRWWLGALEVLNEIERRDYDLWANPLGLSRFHRLQVRFQARFGRTRFK